MSINEKPYLERMKQFVQDHGQTGQYRTEERAVQQEQAPRTTTQEIVNSYHAWTAREDTRMDQQHKAAEAKRAELDKAPGRGAQLEQVRILAKAHYRRGTVEYDFGLD